MKLETEKAESELKIKIVLNATLARQIGEFAGCLLDKNAKITPIHELFPNLFESEDIEEDKSKKDMQLYKAKMDDYAFRHNSRMKGSDKE